MGRMKVFLALGLSLNLIACGDLISALKNVDDAVKDVGDIVNNLPTKFSANKINIESASSLFKAKAPKKYQEKYESLRSKFVPQLHKLNDLTGKIELVAFEDDDGNQFIDVEVTEIEDIGEGLVKIELRYKSTVTVCANINGEPQSINLVEPAVQAHLEAGGTLGPCEGDIDETVDEPDTELTLVYDLVEKTFVISTEWDFQNSQIHNGFLYAFKKESDGWLYRLDPRTMLTADAVKVTNLVNQVVNDAPYKATMTRWQDYNSFGTPIGSLVSSSDFTYQFVIDEFNTFLMWRSSAWQSYHNGSAMSLLFADGETLHFEEANNFEEFNILFYGLDAPSSSHRNFSLIKTPNGKLWMFRFIEENGTALGNIHEISFSETGERQTTTTVVDVTGLGVTVPFSNDYQMNDYDRFIPFEAGFITLSLDNDGNLQAQKTLYNELDFSTRITSENRLTRDAWIKEQYYYWRTDDSIYRIEFLENAAQEEVLNDGTITGWQPLSGHDVIITTATDTRIVYIPTNPFEEIEVEVIADEDLEIDDIIEIPEDFQVDEIVEENE